MYCILVVNDSPIVADVLRSMLERGGYRTATASGGEECLALLEDMTPDLILLDVRMRPMDGWETLEHLKADTGTREIPVAMHTAKHLTPDEIQQYGHLIEDYILIPTTHRQLFDAVEYILNKKARIANEIEFARRSGADSRLIEEFRRLSQSVDVFRRLIRFLELSTRTTDMTMRLGEQLFEAIKTMASGERCMELRLEELKREFHSGRAPGAA
ncbi:MAG: response regulator [Methanomicrobiales archaeon]|nr:response regulator [Methanomicrobiales archaeon]